MGQNAHLIEAVSVEPGIFRVGVENSRSELADGAQIVHLLPYEMRWIEIQAKRHARNLVEHAPPDRRALRQIFASGPLVLCKEHRAVLDGDLYAVVFGKFDNRRPDLTE